MNLPDRYEASFTLVKNYADDEIAMARDPDAGPHEHEEAYYVLFVDGASTAWWLSVHAPSSPGYARGRFSFVLGNTEPQYDNFEVAAAALYAAWQECS